MNTILSLQKTRLAELQKSKKPDKEELKALQDSVKYLEELNKLVLTTNGLALTASKPESEPLVLKFSINGTAFEVTGDNAQKLAKKVVLTLVGSEPKVPSLVLYSWGQTSKLETTPAVDDFPAFIYKILFGKTERISRRGDYIKS